MAGDKLIGHLAAAGAYTIFGLNIVFCRDLAQSAGLSPLAVFSVRAFAASVLFWGLSLVLPREQVAPGDMKRIALASVLGLFIPQLTFLSGIAITTAIDLATLSILTPIFTMFIAAIVLKEPITLQKAGGVVMSFAGVLFLVLNAAAIGRGGANRTSPYGVALMLLNGLSFAAYLGAFRPLISRYSVVTFMKWMFFWALLVSLPFSAVPLCQMDYALIRGRAAWELGFLIFCATFLAYFLIPVGQKHIRPTLVSMYSYLQPIIATIVAIVTGIDSFSWQKLLATLLVAGGVLLVHHSRTAEGGRTNAG